MPDWHCGDTDPVRAVDYFKLHRVEMRTLRRVTVDSEGTRVRDINGNVMFLPGLKLGIRELEALLKLVGASYNPATLHDPPGGRSKEKEFEVVKHDPWGQDRAL